MNRGSLSQPGLGAVALVLAALPQPAAAADLPGPELGEVQNVVGEVVSQANAVRKQPAAPPAPAPARPAPRPAPVPAAPAAPAAPVQPSASLGAAPTTGGQAGDASAGAGSQASKPTAARTGGAQAPDPTDAPDTVPAAAVSDPGDGEEAADTLPFTGSRLLQPLLVATLLLAGGLGLRRAARRA